MIRCVILWWLEPGPDLPEELSLLRLEELSSDVVDNDCASLSVCLQAATRFIYPGSSIGIVSITKAVCSIIESFDSSRPKIKCVVIRNSHLLKSPDQFCAVVCLLLKNKSTYTCESANRMTDWPGVYSEGVSQSFFSFPGVSSIFLSLSSASLS